MVKLLSAFREHYHDIFTLWGLEKELYKNLITCLRNRLNPPVFLTAMLVFCPKVTIDQVRQGCGVRLLAAAHWLLMTHVGVRGRALQTGKSGLFMFSLCCVVRHVAQFTTT